MKIYMLRNKANSLYYKRSNDWRNCWVPQEDASVWTSPQGPQAAKGKLTRTTRGKSTPDVEIMELDTAKPQVTLVDADDWEGLYINGQLVEEHHHVRTVDVLKHLGILCEVIYPDQAWLEERGSLPMNLAEVPSEV